MYKFYPITDEYFHPIIKSKKRKRETAILDIQSQADKYGAAKWRVWRMDGKRWHLEEDWDNTKGELR